MDRICPDCGVVHDFDARLCTRDGSPLVLGAPEDDEMIGAELDGRYEVEGLLGEGGMGRVYLARQAAMDRRVAIKVLRPSRMKDEVAVKRFMREAHAVSRLRHPNTIQVFDFGRSADGQLYMVMELLTGRLLADIIDQTGAMATERAVAIALQVADALSEAHAVGVIHRDLSPVNIAIEQAFGRAEHVKVLDFGIAQIDFEDGWRATQTGAVVGSPNYIAPERIRDAHSAGPRSDIYSLGLVLFEMLTGSVAFPGASAVRVMRAQMYEPAPQLPVDILAATPPALVELVERMLAKDPEERPANCEEVRATLSAAVVGGEIELAERPVEAVVAAVANVRAATTADWTGEALVWALERSGAERTREGSGASPPQEQSATDPGASADGPRADSPYARPTPRPAQLHAMLAALRPMHAVVLQANGKPGGTLVAGNERVGVLQLASGERPLAGRRLELVGEAPPLRDVVLTTEVMGLDVDPVGGAEDVVTLRWLRLASSTPEQLAAAVSGLSGHAVEVEAVREQMRPGRWIAFEPTTGYILPCDPPDSLEEARERRRTLVPRRRMVDVAGRPGGKD